MDQAPLYNLVNFTTVYDLTTGFAPAAHLQFANAQVPALRCPSSADPVTTNEGPITYGANAPVTIVHFNGSYGANASGTVGSGSIATTPVGLPAESQQHLDDACCTNVRYNGIMSMLSTIRLRDVTDGASNTVGVGEWFRGPGPTNAGWTYDHWILTIPQGLDQAGRTNGSMGMPFNFQAISGVAQTQQQQRASFGSFHEGGVHVVFCDGAVRFLSENIDNTVQKGLGTRSGGEVVGDF
jgi:prepilin-type processing-associated H-X9-DG protein